MNKKRKFGLIGKELKHSFSPKYFKEKFLIETIKDADYSLFPLDSIEAFPKLTAKVALSGLNVTIPYKETIIPYLDDVDSIAKEINAVNTIQFKNGESKGFNTDVIGFEKSLKPLLKKSHKSALVFGSGGASKAVVYVLKKLNISFELVSRTKTTLSYSNIDKSILEAHQILINTTPLGMFPATETKPEIAYDYLTNKHLVYDLVYNPTETKFLRLAKKQGAVIKNGQEMLEIQAEESWKIWNS